jgi:hypothetical protein
MIINAKIDEASTSSAQLERSYRALLDSGGNMSEEEYYCSGIEANDVEEMTKLYEIKKKQT